MRVLRSAIGASVLAGILTAAGGHTPVGSGIAHSPRAAEWTDPGALPAFALFGCESPPVESTTISRMAEFAGAGLNLMLPAWADSGRPGDNLVRVDLAAATGAKCLIWDRRFRQFLNIAVDSPAGAVLLDSIVATYRDRSGLGGYYLGDEPPQTQFSLLARLHAALRARDPEHPAWNILPPSIALGGWSAWQSYVRAYLDSTRARVLCYAEYDFLTSGDRGLFVQHLAGAAAIAREYGRAFWPIVQVIQHFDYRALTDGELRWQVSMALAYGARGVGYFTYWTPAPYPIGDYQYGMINWDGSRTHWYDVIAHLDLRVAVTGLALTRLQWLYTSHSGSVPSGATAFKPDAWIAGVEGRAALGMFVDSVGQRCVLIANSDSLAHQTIGLTSPITRHVERLANNGIWVPIDTTRGAAATRVTVDLEAGDFALLRFPAVDETYRPGPGPGLRLDPNPSRSIVYLRLSRVGPSGRIEILNVGGHRIWSQPLAEGAGSVAWDGTSDSGGHAPAGVYFARAQDAGGATVLKLNWLGR